MAPTPSAVAHDDLPQAADEKTPWSRTSGGPPASSLPAEVDVLIIGGGIVGASLAYELARNFTAAASKTCKTTPLRIALLDQGPAYNTGGTTTHAPGGLTQTFHLNNPLLTSWCERSGEVYEQLGAFHNVGSLELAWTEERLAVLKTMEKAGGAKYGMRVIEEMENILELSPVLWGLTSSSSSDGGASGDAAEKVRGALYTPKAGRVDALLAVEKMLQEAEKMLAAAARIDGESFLSQHFLTRVKCLIQEDVLKDDKRVAPVVGVKLSSGETVFAKKTVLCTGAWTNVFLETLDPPQRLAMANIEHTWALTKPLAHFPIPKTNLNNRHPMDVVNDGRYTMEIFNDGRWQSKGAGFLPAIYDGDGKVYYQTYGTQLGIGSYGHAGKIYDLDMKRVCHAEAPFCAGDFGAAWAWTKKLFGGALALESMETRMNMHVGTAHATPQHHDSAEQHATAQHHDSAEQHGGTRTSTSQNDHKTRVAQKRDELLKGYELFKTEKEALTQNPTDDPALDLDHPPLSASLSAGFNGLMSGTPDGLPLVGRIAAVDGGLYVGAACWIKYAVGLGEALARQILFEEAVPGQADVNRFSTTVVGEVGSEGKSWSQADVEEAVRVGYENRTALPKKGAVGWQGMYNVEE